MAERIQRRRSKGWRMPEGAIYVGRPSKWGNPFIPGRISDGSKGQQWTGWTVCDSRLRWQEQETTYATRQDALRACVVAWLDEFLNDPLRLPRAAVLTTELGGRDLACWCPLNQPCHADVLLEVANP